MARAKELLCPNCDAPLPVVTLQTKTECAYCGRLLILEPAAKPPPPAAPYPPPARPANVGQRHPNAASKSGLVITLVILAAAGGMAYFIFTMVNRQISQQANARREISRTVEQATRRATEAQDRAMEQMSKAFDLPPEIEALKARAEAARNQAAVARAEREEARRERASKARTSKRTKPPAKPLPKRLDDKQLERALKKLSVSHCPGPGFIVYTMRVNPSGKLETVSQGPMHVSGKTHGCIGDVMDKAKHTLTFPKTQEGSGPVKSRLEAPE